MNVAYEELPTSSQCSPGLGRLAIRRLLKDRVGVFSAIVVGLCLLVVIASGLGLVADDWNTEVGVYYANPSFLAGQENLEAKAATQAREKDNIPPVDLSDVDPLAPWYAEWDRRTKEIKVTEIERAQTLPFGGDKMKIEAAEKLKKMVEQNKKYAANHGLPERKAVALALKAVAEVRKQNAARGG